MSRLLGAFLCMAAVGIATSPVGADTSVVAGVAGPNLGEQGPHCRGEPSRPAHKRHDTMSGGEIVLCYSQVDVPSISDFRALSAAFEQNKQTTKDDISQVTKSEIALQLSKEFTGSVKKEIEERSADKAFDLLKAKLNGEGWLLITKSEVAQIKKEVCQETARALNEALRRDRKAAIPINCSGE
jgi:hypothetical protein